MKIFILLVSSFIFFSCSDDVAGQKFDFRKAEGIWVLKEIVYANGTIYEGSFVGIFGAYSESFKLNKDQTFIPVRWLDKETFTLSLAESGNCTFSQSRAILTFSGVWELIFDLIKFERNELWLKKSGDLYKFKRV